MANEQKKMRWVTILVIAMWILALALFLGLYGGLHAPSYQVVVPVVLVVGLAAAGASAWAVEVRAPLTPGEKRQLKQAILKYQAVKERVRGPTATCPQSPLQTCLKKAQQLPAGSKRGLGFAWCQAKTSDRKECIEYAKTYPAPEREDAFEECETRSDEPRDRFATRAPECVGVERDACLAMVPYFHPYVQGQMRQFAAGRSEDEFTTFCSSAASAALTSLETEGY